MSIFDGELMMHDVRLPIFIIIIIPEHNITVFKWGWWRLFLTEVVYNNSDDFFFIVVYSNDNNINNN